MEGFKEVISSSIGTIYVFKEKSYVLTSKQRLSFFISKEEAINYLQKSVLKEKEKEND